ncbi:MAG: lipoprotein [Candidatus Omnitrophota bacterium]
MKKTILLILLALFLSGCANYKFHRGKEPYNKGYVVSRDGYTIPEYTIGKGSSVPNLGLARERFKERKGTVEHYYKQMGYIENNFKGATWGRAAMFLKFTGGIFRLPSIAISDYKYEHNPEYREKVIQIQKERDAKDGARIQKLKGELNSYIEKELEGERNPEEPVSK